MKNRKNANCLLALLLILCMIFPSCSSGIADPVGDSDLGAEGTGLSESEAAALFGAGTGLYTDMFDYPYVYYTGRLYPKSETNEQKTVYRYNFETGETEFACQDSVCTHEKGSGCPFADYLDFWQLSVVDGKVIYTTEGGKEGQKLGEHPLEWYDPKTREHGVFAEDADNRYVIGDTLYFDRTGITTENVASGGDATVFRELWKYDKENEKAVLVASSTDPNDFLFRATLYKGEERVTVSSHYGYDGQVDAGILYLYWIDPATGKRTPMMKEGIYGTSEGWFAGDYFFYEEPVEKDGGEEFKGYVVYSCNIETGEKKALGEGGLYTLSAMIPTDKYLLAVCEDPTGKATRVLRRYDYAAGEWLEEEYPLYGEYYGVFLRYYRGKLYFFMSIKNEKPEPGTVPEAGGYLEWDILTGEQTLIPYSEWM